MSDYSAVAPPQQSFNQSSAFAAALQRAKQIAAKINPGTGGTSSSDTRQKRPLEDSIQDGQPEPKKLAGTGPPPVQASGPPGRPNGPNQSGGPPNMSGPPGPMGGGPPNFNVNEENIKVPDKMVGLIIGRGGEQITRLQAESGCKIQMAPDSGQPERVCSLSGTREAINRAKELIMNIVHQRGRTEGIQGLDLGSIGQNFNSGGPGGPGPNGGQSQGGGGGGPGGPGGRTFVEIMVPGPKVGLIIGKGGETIKQLQERSGAKMVVIQEGPNQEQEKPLRISGDPQKVEYAKQLVYDLIAEKEMQAYNRGGGGRGPRNQQDDRQGGYNDGGYGGGGGNGNEVEVLVPRAAVGVVIGKGGDMIKKIQAETGARVQFQQPRDEGPGDRRCYLSGKPMNVEQARQRIEELIDSVHRRDGDGNGTPRGGGGGGGGARGPPRGGGRGGGGGGNDYEMRGNRNGGSNNQEFGNWEDRRNQQQQQQTQEVSFSVPNNKCGVIIGRGGETIKQINHMSGAHCELDRRLQNSQFNNGNEKTFTIRGDPEQIEAAKKIICDKVQMLIHFNYVNGGGSSGGGGGSSLPTAYPGMAPQGYNPQGWGVPNYQQQWTGGPPQGGDSGGQPSAGGAAGGVQMNPATGQPDYSLQWAEYYRSLGMHREAELIETQAKNKTGTPGTAPPSTQPSGASGQTSQQPPTTPSTPSSANGAQQQQQQPDYSAQWAEYYRSLGKHKEAEAIEAQMKAKVQGGGGTPSSTGSQGNVPGNPSSQNPNAGYQQPYGGGYMVGGYYGGQQGQGGPPQGAPQGQYGAFPGYGYSGPTPPASGGQDQN